MDDALLGRQSAIAEGAALFRLIGPENTVEEFRELIAVSPRSENILRDYVKESPEDAWWIVSAPKFRQTVLEEFNRSVREGLAAPICRKSRKPKRSLHRGYGFSET